MSGNPWTRDQVTALIEAYREETCLYAVKSPNYHCKHVRADALKRVCAAMRPLRPKVNEKECASKFHNLRNQFNVENAKIRASTKSDAGTQNIYKPNLWYFDSIKFVEEHVVPRKRRASRVTTPGNSSIQQVEDTRGSEAQEESCFSKDGMLEVFVDEPDGDTSQFSAPGSPSKPLSSVTVSPIPSPVRIPAVQHRPTGSRPASSSESPSPRPKRPRGSYTRALDSIAYSLRQAVNIPVANPVSCPVDACMSFLGSLLKEFRSEELQLEVMGALTQTVINAKCVDLERAKQ